MAIFTILTNEFKGKGVSIVKSVASGSVDLMIDADPAAIQSNVNQYLDIFGVGYIVVLDSLGEVVTHTFVPEMPQELREYYHAYYTELETNPVQHLSLENLGHFMDVSEPILGGVAGYVHVGMERSVIYSTLYDWLFLLFGSLLLVFLVSVSLSYYSARRISRPLRALTHYSTKVANLDFSGDDVEVSTNDELETLAEAMATMKGELQRVFQGQEQTLNDILAIEQMDDGLVITDSQGKIERMNPRFCEMVQKKWGELHGADLDDLLDLSLISNLRELHISDSESEEVVLPGKRTAKALGKAIMNRRDHSDNIMSSKCVLGYVISMRDITREKELDEMKTAFLATVSHELRTPLTSILGFTSLVQKTLENKVKAGVPEDQKEVHNAVIRCQTNLSVVTEEGERLTGIVDDLLDVMRMESGEMIWSREKFSIGEMIERSIVNTEGLLHTKDFAICSEIPDNLPPVLGDRDRIMQVLINLISNAVKFTKKGKITCSVAVEEKEIVVRVRDTGCGISASDCVRVFQRFKQVGNNMLDKPAGSGLGLAICKEIVTYHEGRMWVESELGVGSIFAFTLPLAEKEIS
jgi:PAS domain S-box-containing protein